MAIYHSSSLTTLLTGIKCTLIGFTLMASSHISAADATPEAHFFISPAGSDQWSGKLPEANANKTDGPFATLERARDIVRIKNKENKGNTLVSIRGGTYQLSKTVVFGLQDSGTKTSSITYAAYPGEKPIFSGGVTIKGLKKLNGGLTGLPKIAHGKIWEANVNNRFLTLFDNQGILPRARSAGFFSQKGSNRDQLVFPAGALKNWANIEDVEIVVRPHHAWILNILPLTSVNEKKRIAHTATHATYMMEPLQFLKTTEHVWVENTLEGLDQPGEWVINTQTKKLYIWPRSDSPIIAPRLRELIRVEGKVDIEGPSDTPVTNLHFQGLTFQHGERYQLDKSDAGLQHDWDMMDKDNALIRLRSTENCSISECHFLHSGSGAIRVDLHGIQNQITSNHIEHMGGGGILLCGYGPGTKDVNKNNLVYNNHIHHIGEIYWHSPGIFLWQSGENRVANNLVHHTPYTSIIISGCMPQFFRKRGRELGRSIRRHEVGKLPKDPSPESIHHFLHSHDNLIEYNEIHNAMEKLGDGNAIYIRGAGANNIIRRNYIHHLITPMIMQCAIRTDGGQRDTLIAENLIYKCTSQGIMLKLNTRVENNIIADVISPPRGYYLSVREGPLTGATIKRNIFYSSDEAPDFINELASRKKDPSEDRRGRTIARVKDADTDYNIYFSKTNPSQGDLMLTKQRLDGVDENSQATDPLFIDPENGDFRLAPNSPAHKMGIIPIDLSKIGLRRPATADHE